MLGMFRQRRRAGTFSPIYPDALQDRSDELGLRFVSLLDLQFWLMGRDVEHPDGNVLCRIGFTREPHPEAHRPSRYTCIAPAGRVIIWPCGILLPASATSENPANTDIGGSEECLVLRGCAPALVSAQNVCDTHDPAQLHAELQRGTSCPPQVLRNVCRWFSRYEQTVDTIVGIAHRTPRPGTTATLAPPEPCSLASRWATLADELSAEELSVKDLSSKDFAARLDTLAGVRRSNAGTAGDGDIQQPVVLG